MLFFFVRPLASELYTLSLHDALPILADCLIQLKDELHGTIKIIHQHAEEAPPGGAKSIVEAGHLDDVDAVFGIHVQIGRASCRERVEFVGVEVAVREKSDEEGEQEVI